MLAIVPARSGSKGLANKNLKRLNGKPLICYTIEAAIKATHISEVIVSTDSEEIYTMGLECGAKPSFLRPDYLATDDSSIIDTYLYTLDRLETEWSRTFDNFVVLQPTSPLRSHTDIDNSITMFVEKQADAVISCCEENHPIHWHHYLDNEGVYTKIFDTKLDNRQENRLSFYPNGAVFVFKKSLIEQRQYYTKKTFGYVMPKNRSIDIDTMDDFEYAEFLLAKRL